MLFVERGNLTSTRRSRVHTGLLIVNACGVRYGRGRTSRHIGCLCLRHPPMTSLADQLFAARAECPMNHVPGVLSLPKMLPTQAPGSDRNSMYSTDNDLQVPPAGLEPTTSGLGIAANAMPRYHETPCGRAIGRRITPRKPNSFGYSVTKSSTERATRSTPSEHPLILRSTDPSGPLRAPSCFALYRGVTLRAGGAT